MIKQAAMLRVMADPSSSSMSPLAVQGEVSPGDGIANAVEGKSPTETDPSVDKKATNEASRDTAAMEDSEDAWIKNMEQQLGESIEVGRWRRTAPFVSIFSTSLFRQLTLMLNAMAEVEIVHDLEDVEDVEKELEKKVRSRDHSRPRSRPPIPCHYDHFEHHRHLVSARSRTGIMILDLCPRRPLPPHHQHHETPSPSAHTRNMNAQQHIALLYFMVYILYSPTLNPTKRGPEIVDNSLPLSSRQSCTPILPPRRRRVAAWSFGPRRSRHPCPT